MFSPRLLAIFAFLALAAAIPTEKSPRPVTTITEDDLDDAPWFSFPMFGNLFAPLWRLFPSFEDIGPKIVVEDDKFQVIVNVKDYKTSDLKVKVKGDFIFVQGSHEAKKDDRDLFASQFFHTYTLPANCSGSDVSAERSSDDYLIVTAPLNGADQTKEVDRDVQIVETGKPYKEEKVELTTVSAVTATEIEDDRKEPTTPSDKELITEKDNSIPHGNDIPL